MEFRTAKTKGEAMAKTGIDNHELITPSPAMFAATDGLAIRTGDAWALVGRVLLGWLFFINAWPRLTGGTGGFAKYLASLGVPAPELMAWVATLIELIGGAALILGVASRYAALLLAVYTVMTIVLAHRYWEYPAAAQMAQYFNFIKNLAITGGLILLFVTGAGRFSVDGWLRNRGS
jgi:putative oxidoreductase